MKTTIHNRKNGMLLMAILFVFLSGCSDLFRDPMIDKETGEKISFLLIDRNFIETKLDIHVLNGNTNLPIETEEIAIEFSGADAGNLITFSGDLQTVFKTSSGYIEVGFNPNITINSQNPLDLTVVAKGAGYISLPQVLSYTSEGIKDIIILMFPISTFKSAKLSPFNEPFDLNFKGVLQSPDLIYVMDASITPTGTAWKYLNLYATRTGGTVLCNNLKDKTAYSDFGVYHFNFLNTNKLLPPDPAAKELSLQNNILVCSSVLKSNNVKCSNGLVIHVERNSKGLGSGVFNYLITFSDGTTKSGRITCTFPDNVLIEPIYYPSDKPAVKVELFSDAQYNVSEAVNLSTPCGGTANFTVTPKSNLKSHKLVTRFSCSDNSVGMSLTIVGEFRKKGSNDTWTSFSLGQGISTLQLVAGAEYDFRINIDGKYNSFSLPTDPAQIEAYLQNNKSPDFNFKNLDITTTDNEVTISFDVEFSDAICDLFR